LAAQLWAGPLPVDAASEDGFEAVDEVGISGRSSAALGDAQVLVHRLAGGRGQLCIVSLELTSIIATTASVVAAAPDADRNKKKSALMVALLLDPWSGIMDIRRASPSSTVKPRFFSDSRTAPISAPP
jgi:hypothetical protein